MAFQQSSLLSGWDCKCINGYFCTIELSHLLCKHIIVHERDKISGQSTISSYEITGPSFLMVHLTQIITMLCNNLMPQIFTAGPPVISFWSGHPTSWKRFLCLGFHKRKNNLRKPGYLTELGTIIIQLCHIILEDIC